MSQRVPAIQCLAAAQAEPTDESQVPPDSVLRDLRGRPIYTAHRPCSVATALGEAVESTRAVRDPGASATLEVALAGADLSNGSYAGATLEGADLRRARAHCADFAGVDFSRARLDGGRYLRCILRGIRLDQSTGRALVFEEADLSHMAAHQAVLPDSRLINCRLSRVELSMCDMTGADLVGLTVRHGNFVDCTFDKSAFVGNKFIGCRFRGCTFVSTRMFGTHFVDCRFEHCNFEGTTADESHFTGDKSQMKRCTVRNSQFARARFSGTSFRECSIVGLSALDGRFHGCVFGIHTHVRASTLTAADLTDVDLGDTTVMHTNLRGADLSRAVLDSAQISNCDLRETCLDDARLPHFQIVPEQGAFIGFKRLAGGVICTLRIPEDARRTSNMVDRKCRASHAVVVDGEGESYNVFVDGPLRYRIGETLTAPDYSDDFRSSAGGGIHFFMTRREAEDYIEGGEATIPSWGSMPSVGLPCDAPVNGW